MEKVSMKQLVIDNRKSAQKTALLPSDETVNSDDIERVLEHVSSNFRWELLESAPAKSTKRMSKKPALP